MSSLVGTHRASRGGSSASGTDTVTEAGIPVYTTPGDSPQEVIRRFQSAGIFDAIRWAYESAVSRVLEDYSEEAGHDAGWRGTTLFTLFRDRLDRVFSCKRYALRDGADVGAGLDLVRAELTEKDLEAMPTLPPDLVLRVNRNGSPGWAVGDLQFLLQSGPFGELNTLPWVQKSPTKQQVAKKTPPAADLPPALFDLEGPAVEELVEPSDDLEPFIAAYALDPVGSRRELIFGRSRFNAGGGEAWYWYKNLITLPPTHGGRREDTPTPPGPDGVPDAPVRLRKSVSAPQKAGEQQ
ncbi:hypothetical protein [Prescottella subtropica]|uniref:hypothetical protein n=1 Tax=Prescottella subtropica TaxID=2545757 RepID=UPI001F500765|nr:hypothetical protein [Prescottella subtropica]